MNRSVAGLGVNEPTSARAERRARAGRRCVVMNAKFAGSMPTVFRQSALFATPVFWSLLKLKIAIAAHHFVASQLMASSKGTQPGG